MCTGGIGPASMASSTHPLPACSHLAIDSCFVHQFSPSWSHPCSPSSSHRSYPRRHSIRQPASALTCCLNPCRSLSECLCFSLSMLTYPFPLVSLQTLPPWTSPWAAEQMDPHFSSSTKHSTSTASSALAISPDTSIGSAFGFLWLSPGRAAHRPPYCFVP